MSNTNIIRQDVEKSPEDLNCSTEKMQEGKLSLIVDNASEKFKKVSSAVCSDLKIVNGVPWKLFIEHSPKNSIRMYPCVVSEESNQKVEAECTVKLLSRFTNGTLVRKYEQLFKPRLVCEFKETISLTELFEPKRGFIKDDKLRVELHVACGSMKTISQSNQSLQWTIEHELKDHNLSRDHNLPERVKYILDSGVGCDCEFIIGIKETHRKASKITLALASDVFEKMFFGSFPVGDVIHIPDIEEDVFDIILSYIYGKKWQFESKLQAVQVYYAADFYMLQQLQISCVEYIWPQNVLEIFIALEFAVRQSMGGLKEHSLKIIRDNTQQAFEQEQFLDISRECLLAVLQESNLKVTSELVVFDAVLEWGKARCLEQGLEVCGTNLRSEVGECILYIRFLSMTADEFSGSPYTSGLLTDKDKDAILMRINSDDNEPMIGHLCCLTKKRTQY